MQWLGSKRDDLVLVGGLSLFVFLLAHHAAFLNPFIINDDVRQQVYWMKRWQIPGLFQDDWLSAYARHYVPWGLQGLYRAASYLLDPLLLSKLLPGVLFVFLACCLHRIGAGAGDRPLGWSMVAAFWFMPFFLDNLSGGLARGFAAPLLALFWLCWLGRCPWGVALAVLLQALLIPYICPLSVGALLISWAWGRLRERPTAPLRLNAAQWSAVGLATLIVLLWNHQYAASGFGPLVSGGDMQGRPEFAAQGRYPILPVASLPTEVFLEPFKALAATSHSGSVVMTVIGCALLASAAAYGALRGLRFPRPLLEPVLCIGLASLVLHVLARVFILKLFIPSRYLVYTVNLFLCLGIALCLREGVRSLRVPPRWIPWVLICIAALGGLRLQGTGLFDYSQYRLLYVALSETPINALIAGHPALMDNVPVFAQRKALATYELAHPWSKGLWQRLDPILRDLFAAYYADDPAVVRAFCERYAVDFAVVDDRHFTPAFLQDRPFFAPFDELIRALAKDKPHFALLSEPSFPRKRIDAHIQLLDLRPATSSRRGRIPDEETGEGAAPRPPER